MHTFRRNDPCPCGNGKKYKHCHGRDFGPPPIPEEMANAVRFVCFETHIQDFRLATNGGTAFVVKYKGAPYAITCCHVVKGFKFSDLVITNSRFGKKVAGINRVYFPGNLKDDIEGSDIADICIITFKDYDGEFFEGTYDLDKWLATSSEPADRLAVTGFLKQKSSINPPNIFAALCFLQFTDAGVMPSDKALRRGLATYSNPAFESITGISGAPVYNLNKNALCGMVVRGGLNTDGTCTIYYLDIFDIMQFLNAISTRLGNVIYTKDGSIL